VLVSPQQEFAHRQRASGAAMLKSIASIKPQATHCRSEMELIGCIVR